MKFISTVLLIFLATQTFAQVNPEKPSNSDFLIFEAPKIVSSVAPKYPESALFAGKEGYVVFNLMVDTEGKVFEPTVVESIGPKSMEKAAKRVLDDLEFEPAKLNGKAVEGSHYYKFTFVIDEKHGARRKFVSRYKKFNNLFSKQSFKEARAKLDELQNIKDLNFYELAFLNVARYRMASLDNKPEQQLRSLRAALMYENKDHGENYLPEEILPSLRLERFKLEMSLNRFSEALETLELIGENGDEDLDLALNQTGNGILELKNNNTAYAVKGNLGSSGLWRLDLLKKAFYLEDVSGEINEIKLRCQAKYVFFQYSSGGQYNIPESWGNCEIEILGSAETSFSLIQLKPSV